MDQDILTKLEEIKQRVPLVKMHKLLIYSVPLVKMHKLLIYR